MALTYPAAYAMFRSGTMLREPSLELSRSRSDTDKSDRNTLQDPPTSGDWVISPSRRILSVLLSLNNTDNFVYGDLA